MYGIVNLIKAYDCVRVLYSGLRLQRVVYVGEPK